MRHLLEPVERSYRLVNEIIIIKTRIKMQELLLLQLINSSSSQLSTRYDGSNEKIRCIINIMI